ncbi:MAG: FapA family protein [Bdellovibrionota bacterium]
MADAVKDGATSAPEDGFTLIHSAETDLLRARVSVTQDRMKLFLDCELKEQRAEATVTPTFSRLLLMELLPKSVPAKLLHVEVLDDIAERLGQGQTVRSRRIAKGIPPGPSRDGRLVLLVKTYNGGSRNSELVDPWFIKHFDNIEAGMVVGRIYPPQPGTVGVDVMGTTLSAPLGKEISVKLHESLSLNTQPDKSYAAIVANTSGYLKSDSESLQVIHDLVLAGDVNPHTGDLSFIGNILIRGNVKKNYRVSARENIEIDGYVQDARLTSTQGNITVKGHVSGDVSASVTLSDNIPFQQLLRIADSRKPQITCAGTFKAQVLDRVTIEALGDIEIEKEARACFLRTRATLRMPKGQLIGGDLRTVCGAEVSTYGTSLGTETRISLCSDIESSAEFGAIIEKLKAHDSAEEMIMLYLGPYAANPSRIVLLQPALRAKMEKLQHKLNELQSSRKALLAEQAELLSHAKHTTVYRINVMKVAHPGTIITAGEDIFTVAEDLPGPKTIEYFPKEKRFAVGELQPLQCVLEA